MVNEANADRYYSVGDFWRRWEEKYKIPNLFEPFEDDFQLIKGKFKKAMPIALALKWISVYWLVSLGRVNKIDRYTEFWFDSISRKVRKKFRAGKVGIGDIKKEVLKKTENMPYSLKDGIDGWRLENLMSPREIFENLSVYWESGLENVYNYPFPMSKSPKDVFSELEGIVTEKKTIRHIPEPDSRLSSATKKIKAFLLRDKSY